VQRLKQDFYTMFG